MPRPTDDRFETERTFAWLEPAYAAYETARVVILPVPYDATTTARAGTREGPAAIIDASADMEWYDVALEREPYRVGIHTLPDLAVHAGSPAAMVDRVASVVADLLADGKFVVTLGGEHSITAGCVRAHAQRYPDLTVLYLDAHADLREEYLDTPFNHACALRRSLEHARGAVHVGLRSATREEHEFIRRRGIPVFPAHTFRREPDAPARIAAALGEHVYVSVDLDVLDPSQMPAVGTPEPGGLFWDDVTAVLAEVARTRRVVGFDVNELAPMYGPPASAQLAAKLVYRMIGLFVRE
ncbi:MAG TPA: agmatinase [Dehalococcoidia bacterium]